jgi:hypothetical protein
MNKKRTARHFLPPVGFENLCAYELRQIRSSAAAFHNQAKQQQRHVGSGYARGLLLLMVGRRRRQAQKSPLESNHRHHLTAAENLKKRSKERKWASGKVNEIKRRPRNVQTSEKGRVREEV